MKFQTELSNWSTTKLRQACTDIIEFKGTGILKDGPVREFAEQIRTEQKQAELHLTLSPSLNQ